MVRVMRTAPQASEETRRSIGWAEEAQEVKEKTAVPALSISKDMNRTPPRNGIRKYTEDRDGKAFSDRQWMVNGVFKGAHGFFRVLKSLTVVKV